MKHNNSFWHLFGKRQDKENLLRNSLMNQFWMIFEAKPFVKIRGAYKGTALASNLFQHKQAFIDKCLADAMSLMIRQYGNWAEYKKRDLTEM